MVTLQQSFLASHVKIYNPFKRSHLEYCFGTWSDRIYHNSNLKLLQSTQRRDLSLILRSFKSTPTVALEAELGILPMDIRLLEFSRMECLKLLRKNDNALKEKLIASFRNSNVILHHFKTLPSKTQEYFHI